MFLRILILAFLRCQTSAHRTTGTNPIDWSVEPPPPPEDSQEAYPQDQASPAHHREDKMLSFLPVPPVPLPEGTLILPDGIIRFPNSSTLLTRYQMNSTRPAALLSSGDIILANGTKISSNSTNLPPPGIPLKAFDGAKIYPPLLLPSGAVIYRNGSVAVGKRPLIMTVFQNGFIPECNGVLCHHLTPNKH